MNCQMKEPLAHTSGTFKITVQMIWRLSLVICLLGFWLLGGQVSAQEGGADDAEDSPAHNLFNDPHFEGNFNYWGTSGGDVGLEDTAQHQTPFWGSPPNASPYGGIEWEPQIKNAYLEPNGQLTRLAQPVIVQKNNHYRFSLWVRTSGMTATAKYYSELSGITTECGSTNGYEYALISCEFKATADGPISFFLEGNAAPGSWIATDDWALTRIVKPPRSSWPLWSSLPVKYYTNGTAYTTRLDIAAGRWNSSVGKTMLQKTSDNGIAKIFIYGVYNGLGQNVSFATTTYSNGLVLMEVNKSWMDIWTSYRLGYEARESVLGHELGHALGLAHPIAQSCNILAADGTEVAWFCSTKGPTWGDAQKIKNLYP